MVVHAHPCEIKFFHFQFLRSRVWITQNKSFSILEPQVQTTPGSGFIQQKKFFNSILQCLINFRSLRVQEKGSKTHVILNNRQLVYENIGNIKGYPLLILRYLPKSFGSYRRWVIIYICTLKCICKKDHDILYHGTMYHTPLNNTQFSIDAYNALIASIYLHQYFCILKILAHSVDFNELYRNVTIHCPSFSLVRQICLSYCILSGEQELS